MCLIFHKYEVHKAILGEYLMRGRVYYDVYLDQCINSKCEKRRIKVIGVQRCWSRNNGLKRLKYRWIRFGKT